MPLLLYLVVKKKVPKSLWGEIDVAIPLENKITGHDGAFEQTSFEST